MFNNVDNPANKDKKLSFLEKAVLKGGINVGKIILWKVGKINTYGELSKLGSFIEKTMDEIEEKYGNEETKIELTLSNHPEDAKSDINKINQVFDELSNSLKKQ